MCGIRVSTACGIHLLLTRLLFFPLTLLWNHPSTTSSIYQGISFYYIIFSVALAAEHDNVPQKVIPGTWYQGSSYSTSRWFLVGGPILYSASFASSTLKEGRNVEKTSSTRSRMSFATHPRVITRALILWCARWLLFSRDYCHTRHSTYYNAMTAIQPNAIDSGPIAIILPWWPAYFGGHMPSFHRDNRRMHYYY